MVRIRASLFKTQPRDVKCDKCNKIHKLQTLLPHDLHVTLQKEARKSKWGTINDYIIDMLMDKFGFDEIEGQMVYLEIPEKKIKVYYSDLQNAPIKELREFAYLYGLNSIKKKEIIELAFESKYIVVIDDAGVQRCSWCRGFNHNIRTCKSRPTAV